MKAALTNNQGSPHALVIGPPRGADLAFASSSERTMEEIRSMKTALSAIALATALTLAPFVGGSFAVADDSAQREEHGDVSAPEDRAAFLDARIAALKAGLELNAEQEKNWAAARIGDARSRQAKSRALRRLAGAPRRQSGWGRRSQPDRSPHPRFRAVERPRRRPAESWPRPPSRSTTAWTTARSAGSRCFSVGPMGRGQWRHWRREG